MSPLPAGPDASPLAQTVAYHRDPLGVLRRTRARHGPVFTLRFVWKDPLVFVADPAAARGLLESDPRRAHAGAARRDILPQASPLSPFGADGEQHRATRGRMEPAFSPEAIARSEPRLREIAAEHAARWPVGRPFRLLPRMRTLAIECFLRTVLGVAEPQPLVAAIRRMLWTPGNPPLPLPGDGDGAAGRAGNVVFAQRKAPVEQLLRAQIAVRRAAGGGDDLLGRMVAAGLGDGQIVEELLVVLMAAQEPPSIAMTNVVLELARNGGTSRPPAEAEIAEALRVRPAAQAALRRLTEPLSVAGHELPAGTDVALPSLLLHRDPAAFPAPDAFRPERFAGGGDPPAAYFPFGGGARRCIGEPLARAQFRAVLPELLSRLSFQAAWPRPERMVVRGTVLVPHRNGLVQATAR